MGRDQQSQTCLSLLMEENRKLGFMTDIQAGGRLVEEKKAGVLSESSGDEDSVLLTAGNLTDILRSQTGEIAVFECSICRCMISLGLPEPLHPRGSAHEDDLLYGESEWRFLVLRHEGDSHCSIFWAKLGEIGAFAHDRARTGCFFAGQKSEESRLPRSILAEQNMDTSRLEGQ